jgi:hypothetical protein
LHPPLLRALGRQRKIALGPAWRPVLRLLARGKVLRGTPLESFGRSRVRRTERELRDGYRAMVRRLAGELTAGNYATAVAAAQAADLVRGYEDIKPAGVRAYADRFAELGVPRRPFPAVALCRKNVTRGDRSSQRLPAACASRICAQDRRGGESGISATSSPSTSRTG